MQSTDPSSPGADKLVDLWMHRNSLAWSRGKAAGALQAGIFVGWYYAMYDDLPEVALPLAIFGALVTVILALLALGDLAARNGIHEQLTSGQPAATAPVFGKIRPDRLVLSLVFGALLIGDGALAWASWKHPDFMAPPADDDGGASNRVVRNAGPGAWL